MFGIFNKNKEEVKSQKHVCVDCENAKCSVHGKDEKGRENTDGVIQFEDFMKVEMTVGEIIEAEKVENADRLLKLKVDFGSEQRQIVSGIAEYFSPEELIGKKSPFVTNLEPRKIRGEESNGMILAAKDKNGNFSLMSVDDKIEKGTRLS
jgi:methionyl-tRNA synthetase